MLVTIRSAVLLAFALLAGCPPSGATVTDASLPDTLPDPPPAIPPADAPPPDAPPDRVEAEEYEVYAAAYAALARADLGRHEVIERVAVRTPTSNHYPSAEPIRTKLEGLEDSTVVDYAVKNVTAAPLSASMLDFGLPAEVMTDAERRRLRRELRRHHVQVLKRLEEQHLHPVLFYFSRVGFNTAHTQALVYVGRPTLIIGGCCDGRMLLLQKKHRRWVIVSQVVVWMS